MAQLLQTNRNWAEKNGGSGTEKKIRDQTESFKREYGRVAGRKLQLRAPPTDL